MTRERAGFDGLWTLDGTRDPFLPVAVAATCTRECLLGTGVAIAFARNPMTIAIQANDLREATAGRFVLGLGTQVRAHIERRFSMPWSEPAARLSEFVGAVRAIWRAWEIGGPLRFEGDFYRYSLMPPAFAPPPNPFGYPPIFVGGVGERIVRAGAAVADGLLCHPLLTPDYLDDIILPAVQAGRRDGGCERPHSIVASALVATGADREELNSATEAVRRQIAFYASTPGYLPILRHHGLDAVHPELHSLSRSGGWEQMPDLIDDEALGLFAIVGEPADVADALERRYGERAARVTISTPYQLSDSALATIGGRVRARS
jgi:probable F420-dependent oxidoreductase